MNKFLIIAGIVLAVGLIWIGIVYTTPPKILTPVVNTIATSTSPTSPSLNTGSNSPVTTPNQSIPNQQASAGTQPEIAKAMLGQIQNANLITLKGTSVVSTYALQIWGDENKGGEALLQYDDAKKEWILVNLGGGLWAADGLMAFGVPQVVAEQLIQGLQLQ